jgi:hypothetical protein
MSNNNPYAAQAQTVYQADSTTLQSIKATKDKVMELSKKCMHRPVRVQMFQGQQLEGIPVHVDSQFMYLKVEMPPEPMRQQYNPYYNAYNSSVILPLVLYELLVITLLH